MAKFSLTKRAIADLVDIARYTEKHWGPEQRNKYLTILDSGFQQLAATPTKEEIVAIFGMATGR